MDWIICRYIALFALVLLTTGVQHAVAGSEDLGDGFMDHGVATPISNHRGTVATIDGEGDPVVLSWLMDHRGTYSLLVVNARTGETEQFTTPQVGDNPFASVLSSSNRYYTHYGSTFMEFDPTKREFTFVEKTAPRMAMSMTEADDGTIWSASYPQSGVVSYNPETGQFRDYGHVYKQNWRQYPRDIAVDDQGWVYFGIGNTKSQMIILDAESGEATPVLEEDERRHGRCPVWRYQDGKVYGRNGDQWYELYNGQATQIDAEPEAERKPIIQSTQSLFHRSFPTGHTLKALDLVDRRLVVETPEGEIVTHEFDYESEGAHSMGLAAAPDGTICGGTAFPMRFFSYDPETDEWTNRNAMGQWNTIEPTDELFYIGAYTHGLLEVWDPFSEWVPTEKGNPDSNPRLLAEAGNVINRPHDLLAIPEQNVVIMAGTPGYGLTGGGLLFWDTETEEETLLTHEDILEWQSTRTLVPLPDGKLLAGTTVGAGTGGEAKAEVAELYIMDMETKDVEWHDVAIDGARTYYDMVMVPDGKAFGILDGSIFFVFEPEAREIVHQENVEEQFGRTASGQGPRVFVTDDEGRYFILFQKGIAELDPETYEITMLAESPVAISPGGDYLDGRIYFGHGSHLYSWQVPNAQ